MGKGPAFAPLTLKDYISQMRPIPGGTFLMGSNQITTEEAPKHPVRLSPFLMGATPVTVGMWQEYLFATGRSYPNMATGWGWKPDHPMVCVSYEDIAGEEGVGGYCGWASEKAGLRLRLPTEAQWEYCAQDGRKGIAFPWGNRFDAGLLWCSRKEGLDAKRTSPVVREERIFVNSLGLSDMAGNVWQWCRDWYGPYPAGPTTDPNGPSLGKWRCFRGGSWYYNDPGYFRCAFRNRNPPVNRYNNLGFRLSAEPA